MYETLQNKEQAIKFYKRALAVNPNLTQAKDKLKKLVIPNQ